MSVVVSPTSRPGAASTATGLAEELLDRHPGPLHHHCPTCGSLEHGAPSFDAPVTVSIAHAAGLTLVAVSTLGAVGIDLEPAGTADRHWVEEEAIGKARGTGLTSAPQERAGVVLLDLEVPGYAVALAVLGSEVPEVRMLPAAPAAPSPPASW